MMLAMAAFVSNDMVMKLVMERVPLPQAVFLRGLIATVMIGAVAAMAGKLHAVRRGLNKRVIVRGIAEISATVLFLGGLMHTQLPNATAIANAAPLVMTLMAIVFLDERVGIRRWGAILVGFAGILLIVRPGAEGFNAYTLLIVGATLAISARDLLTRGLDRDIPSVVVTLVTTVMVTVAFGGAVLAAGEWRPIALTDIAFLAAASVLILVGFQFIIISLRIGDVSATAPFRYTVILWSLLIGYLVWGDVPGSAAIAGIVLITASGVYVFHREYRIGRGVLTGGRR